MADEPASEDLPKTTTTRSPGGLADAEYYWRDHQQWLEQCGYLLRPRYKPEWVPSWRGTKKHFRDCEDGLVLEHPTIIDATRVSDGALVSLKKISTSVHPYEVEIGQYLCSEELIADPNNHCIPLYDVLQDPDEENVTIVVMPLLRECDDPEFKTVGEVVEFIQQLITGLKFMHAYHVAHRDIMLPNVMLDPKPMFPDMYHPRRRNRRLDFKGTVKHYSRTERPTKYYYVDFGLSRKYNPEDGSPRELPILGGDKSVPEFQGEGYDIAVDPFPTDIYYLGNLVRMAFLQQYDNFQFLHALVTDMVQDDPQKRPSIEVVASRFTEATSKLSARTLRGRLRERGESVIIRFFRGLEHVFRTAKYVVKRLPPVPTPPA
ncbi:hypothetical protein POSPLADRAFT_1177373 [Postia placenta MAD-698-R-SB12]|uniref:Protein kinase domain-containing protein n=1 Tax=Postia placenta MAD-698-R-SB12 TaxID=670580 RepID=A0A1X6NBT5_9APHY|nr:hypothetical protein POSPLADRAFT_1177373 [Postia placenta MAD-698-R-SB12]OSX65916.1 hypothetical protein POSPLADRAFT_1177373 [Postia placenta MAD-698-R-SB12]